MDLTSLITVLAVAGFLLVIVGFAAFAVQTAKKKRILEEEVRESEKFFEEELLRSIGTVGAGTPGQPGPPVAPTASPLQVPSTTPMTIGPPTIGKDGVSMPWIPGGVPPTVGAPIVGKAPAAATENPPPASGDRVEDLARRLMGLRIITERQGRVPLPIQPDGLIFGLRQGGACLLLPRLEHPDLMQHFTKRFEMVFVVGDGDEVLVVERLQQRLPELLE